MDYAEAIDYLYSRLPMFTRIGASAIKKDLTNTLALCKRLDNPHQKFRSVHIGGTNGKGSTSHMLASILQTAGYKTGLYTSPHLLDFRERIRINGEMIPEAEVANFINDQKTNIEEIDPSFFEVTVAMAFNYFARQQVDIAIIEVGLGGRLDSTNIITPLLSVITNIGYDHVNILGNTLPEIAFEKAGIIKPGIPVIIGEKQPEVENVFIRKAKECGSEIIFASDRYQVTGDGYQVSGLGRQTSDIGHQISDIGHQTSDLQVKVQALTQKLSEPFHLSLDLTGSYQLKNLPGVLCAVDELKKQNFDIKEEQVTSALKQVKLLTGLMGRWQILSQKPLIICDTGHNADGIREVIKNITATPHKHLHVVIGMMKDKESDKVLSQLPENASYYFCKPDVERGKAAGELETEAKKFNLHGATYPSVKVALEAAKAQAQPDDLIFIGGSTFVVAEVI